MASKDVAPVLAREFVDLKIDVDRMTGGKDVLARFRPGEKAGIPWFALLDGAGNVLATSDGPKGNVGFPYEPFEIEHFGAMLAKSCKRLSSDETGALLRSLTENREKAERAKAEKAKAKTPG